jgi:ribosomal protein S7
LVRSGHQPAGVVVWVDITNLSPGSINISRQSCGGHFQVSTAVVVRTRDQGPEGLRWIKDGASAVARRTEVTAIFAVARILDALHQASLAPVSTAARGTTGSRNAVSAQPYVRLQLAGTVAGVRQLCGVVRGVWKVASRTAHPEVTGARGPEGAVRGRPQLMIRPHSCQGRRR